MPVLVASSDPPGRLFADPNTRVALRGRAWAASCAAVGRCCGLVAIAAAGGDVGAIKVFFLARISDVRLALG